MPHLLVGVMCWRLWGGKLTPSDYASPQPLVPRHVATFRHRQRKYKGYVVGKHDTHYGHIRPTVNDRGVFSFFATVNSHLLLTSCQESRMGQNLISWDTVFFTKLFNTCLFFFYAIY